MWWQANELESPPKVSHLGEQAQITTKQELEKNKYQESMINSWRLGAPNRAIRVRVNHRFHKRNFKTPILSVRNRHGKLKYRTAFRVTLEC